MNYVIVFIGAGLGGVFRYLMSPAVQNATGWIFPIGTLSVNMLGCFIIGALGQLADSKSLFTPEARLFFFVGILGGFTTFSSFGYETYQLIRSGEVVYAIANATIQVVLGLLLVWLGYTAMRTF